MQGRLQFYNVAILSIKTGTGTESGCLDVGYKMSDTEKCYNPKPLVKGFGAKQSLYFNQIFKKPELY